MDAITCTALRANLASTMDRVCNDHEEETADLLRTPAPTDAAA